jgi:hypothetical protein
MSEYDVTKMSVLLIETAVPPWRIYYHCISVLKSTGLYEVNLTEIHFHQGLTVIHLFINTLLL